jgi:hypothetical protein
MFEIPLSQVPNHLIASIAETLHRYSIALIKVTTDPIGPKKALHIGSATLVSVGPTHGLLTASHVANKLDGPCALGLTLVPTANSFEIDKNYLQIIPIGKPVSTEHEYGPYGPDLSFIALLAHDVGTIKAYRSFYPLSPDKEEILLNPPPLDKGIWCACGSPGERTMESGPEKGFDTVYSLQDLCLAGGVKQEQVNSEFDYLLIDIEHVEGQNLPRSFGGMSGGGLWQVLIERTPQGEYHPRRYILSGVIFYEWLPKAGPKFLRCHGRQSIYRNVYQIVEAMFNTACN